MTTKRFRIPKWIEKELLNKGYTPLDDDWNFCRLGHEFWAAMYHKDKNTKSNCLITVSSYTCGYAIEILKPVAPAIRAEDKKFTLFL